MHSARIHALLVGINAYQGPGLVPLRGAVNDVRALARLLCQRFRVPAGQIRVLEDADATRAAIYSALREHLFAPARASAADGPMPTILWFHFSGTGAQRRCRAGRVIETVVPFGGRSQGGWDIEDWELGQWIADGIGGCRDRARLTVSLDCCHAGSGTRGVDARGCAPDPRPRPPELQPPASRKFDSRNIGSRNIDSRNIGSRNIDSRNIGSRNIGSGDDAAGWLVPPEHVLVAACRSDQKAYEHTIVEGGQMRHYGALSYFLIEALARMPQAQPWTYRELCWRVREHVMRRYDQSPQCEGDRDRLVLGGARAVHAPALRVIERFEDQAWIDGGVVHGLAEGAVLRTCATHARAVDSGPDNAPQHHRSDRLDAPGVLRVLEAGAAQSCCRIESGDVPVHVRVELVAWAAHLPRSRVAVDVPSPALRARIGQRLAGVDLAPHVRFAQRALGAELTVREHPDGALHVERAGRCLCRIVPGPHAGGDGGDGLDALARALLHVCRFDRVADLHGHAPRGRLHGAIRAGLHALLVRVGQPLDKAPLVASSDGSIAVTKDQPVVVDIENRHHVPLHVAVLSLGSDFSIAPLYPRVRGTNDALPAGEHLTLGLAATSADQLFVSPPLGCDHSREIIQIFASPDEFDCEILEQPALADSLAELHRFRHSRPIPRSLGTERTNAAGSILERRFERAVYGNVVADTRGLDTATEPELDPEAWTSARIDIAYRAPSAAAPSAHDRETASGVPGAESLS